MTALFVRAVFYPNLDTIKTMLTPKTPPGTIRNFNLARDGEVVANLIEEAFALKMIRTGKLC